MRNDLIELLALLVSVGYIKSFRVTKNYIYVTMKNDRQKESGVKSVSISGNYPNRGSNTIFRVYVEVEYYDAGESGRKELPSGRKKR